MKIATIAGIPIRIHFTFLLVFVWISLTADGHRGLSTAALIGGIFFCVLLHELGHALTAKAFGIRTRDITLYPIGGLATLLDRPKPKQEFWIALAGPLVNVAIALILWPIVLATDGRLPSFQAHLGTGSVQSELLIANLILPVFNMIPAFPMDGGRVLRAILGMMMPEAKATQIAGKVGQVLAGAGVVLGIATANLMLVLIAVFVFLGASQEMEASIGHSLMEGRKVSDAMLTDFAVVSHSDTIDDAAKLLISGSQQDFPVRFGDEVLGILTRNDIVRGMSTGAAASYVAGFMRRDVGRLRPSDDLENAVPIFGATSNCPILVMSESDLVGLLTVENLGEYMVIQRAKTAN
ncbi:MAG: site-2 protease family protein [Fimbriimonadales bacterium]